MFLSYTYIHFKNNRIQNAYRFPFNSGTIPAIKAANPTAPAPSTTHFSSSTKRKTAIAI